MIDGDTLHHIVAIRCLEILIISKVRQEILNHRDTPLFCEIHLRQYKVVENKDITGLFDIPHNSIHRPHIHIHIHEQVAFFAIKRHIDISVSGLVESVERLAGVSLFVGGELVIRIDECNRFGFGNIAVPCIVDVVAHGDSAR